MKIAHVCSFWNPAICGVKQVVEELAKRQIAQGHEVHVYCSDWDKEKRQSTKEEIINGIHIHRCYHWFRVANFATVWPSILWKLPKENFDMIHTHVSGHAHTFFASFIAKIKKIPLVHTTHCPWSDTHRSITGRIFMGLTYQTFMRLSFIWSQKIIAITPWELSYIKKYGGKNPMVIPNGMDSIFFKEIKKNTFKQKNKIQGKMILFFGRLNITKGPDKFVLAAKEILKERKDLTFVLLGPDEGMKPTIESMIKDTPIKLLPPLHNRKEIAEMYQAAQCFVLPSFREGLPLTLFEAMASGLPIVASPVNGIPFAMNEDNGFLVNYGDISTLKEKILTIVDNKKLADKISKNNKRKALAYNWDVIEKKYMKAYEEAKLQISKVS